MIGQGPQARLTVMQVAPDLQIGGAQETVRTLAKYLPSAGCPTVVCTFSDGPLRREIEQLGVPVEILPGRRYGVLALPLFLQEMWRRRRDLTALVAKHHVDVIQTQGLGTLDFLVMTLAIGRKVQVWWTIQNQAFMVRREHLTRQPWLLTAKRIAHRWLYRSGAKLVDGVIAVSDDTARAFRETVGHVDDKVIVVTNAVDVARYPAAVDREEVRARLGLASTDHLMIMVGTFKRQKGHRYLIEAARSVLPQLADLQILLAGDGELAEEIKALVRNDGLAGQIHFLGDRRDIPELLATSDSFVLPSLWEGLSVALVEAMASGLPVIATEVSGTTQVMVDGETGWLVPPGDPGALARAMIELYSDASVARARGAAGRERVLASFSARSQAEQLAAMFRMARYRRRLSSTHGADEEPQRVS